MSQIIIHSIQQKAHTNPFKTGLSVYFELSVRMLKDNILKNQVPTVLPSGLKYMLVRFLEVFLSS